MRIALVGAARAPARVPQATQLAAALAARGHEVRLLPRPHARLPRPPGIHLYEDGIEAVPEILLGLRRHPSQVIHALDPAAGWAAARHRRRGGPPYVLALDRTLDRAHLVARRRRIEMLSEAAAGAALVIVSGERAAEALRRYAITDRRVIAGGWEPEAYESLYREALGR